MKKLWKRLVMLAALIGCMATAAWAIGAEDMEKQWYGNQRETMEADGFYMTGSYRVEPDGSTVDRNSIKSYFNSNGDVTLCMSNNGRDMSITQYEYDKNGNLVKEKNVWPTVGEYRGSIATLKYDDCGRVFEKLVYYYPLGDSDPDYDILLTRYEYSDHQVIEYYEMTCEGHEEDNYSGKTIITLDDNGRAVKRVTYYGGTDSTSTFLYTYDEKGNLIYEVWGEITYSYTYNDKNLVTKDNGFEYEYEYDENGNVIKRTVSGGSTYYYTYAPIPQGGSKSSFKDVGATEYYNMPVIWASDTGVTKGTSDTTFSPNQSCTRGQLVTFLWRAAGSPEPETSENPFTDVAAGSYYEKAVLWAVENNITNGVDVGRFAPNRTCTRAQIVTFIYRAAGEPDIEVQSESFTDVAADAYYAKAVAWAVANDITNGVDVGLFAPDRTCTRGQGVTFLYRGIGLY